MSAKIIFGLLISMAFLSQTGYSQSMERNVTASAGASGSGPNISVDYTIGETIVLTVSGSGTTLTQGFHQPASGPVAIEDITAFTYSVFPNPFADVVQVSLNIENTSSVQLQLTDLYGRVVYTEDKQTMQAGDYLLPLNTRQLSSGTYIMTVSVQENSGKLTSTSSTKLNLIR